MTPPPQPSRVASTPAVPERTSLRALAALFLRLGATCFGGPAAHIAVMRDEVVRRRGWMTDERFLDLFGATNLIPGPNSTEMVIHIGFDRRRWLGLVVAGTCFIVPSMLIAGACGYAYVEWEGDPTAEWLLYGVKPAVLAVVAQAVRSLAPAAVKTGRLAVIAAIAVLASALGVDAITVLLLAGVIELFAQRGRAGRGGHAAVLCAAGPLLPAAAFGAAAEATLSSLFLVFAKVGALLFGSGYVLIAFLRDELVHARGWLTEAQLVDAIAVGQLMPGPVSTAATFVGWVLLGPTGALVATAGMFVPAFFFVAVTAPFVRRLRASPRLGAFADGVNVASVALMGVVTIQLGGTALVDVWTVAIALVALLLALTLRVNSVWLVAGGAGAGWLIHSFGG